MTEVAVAASKSAFSYVDSALVFAHFDVTCLDEERDELRRAIEARDRDRESGIAALYSLGLRILTGRLWSLYHHEWHHCLQNLWYPFLYLQSWREFAIALEVVRSLRHTDAAIPLSSSSMPTMTLHTSLFETFLQPTMLFGVELEAGQLRLVERDPKDQRRSDITIIDLLENATSLFQFQMQAKGGADGRAYRRWIQSGQNAAYVNVFNLLARAADVDFAYAALAPLVQAAFRTTWPVTTFVALTNALLERPAPTKAGAKHVYAYLIDLMESMGRQFPRGAPQISRPASEDPLLYIDDAAFEQIVRQTPQHTIHWLAARRLELLDQQPDWDNVLLDVADEARWAVLRRDFGPALTMIRFADPITTDRNNVQIINPLLVDQRLQVDAEIRYADYLPEMKRRKDVAYALFSRVNLEIPHTCHHAGCRYFPFGLCRRWNAIPATASQCGFPGWVYAVLNRRFNRDNAHLRRNHMELEIVSDSQSLKELQAYLAEHGGEELDMEPINGVSGGFQKEPIVVGLVVALGGPVVTRQIASVIKQWLKQRHDQKLLKLALLTKNGKKEVTAEELEKIS